jgi:hypothetical protein
MRLSGTSLASALRHLGKVVSMQHRGIQIEHELEAERSAYVTMRFPEPVSDFIYATWEAAYRFGREITGEPTLWVGRFEISEGGKVGRVRIQW